jgi:hypothetical protein
MNARPWEPPLVARRGRQTRRDQPEVAVTEFPYASLADWAERGRFGPTPDDNRRRFREAAALVAAAHPALGVAAERYELTLTPWGTLADAFGRDCDPATGLPRKGELPFRWCPVCGTDFVPERRSHRYCSDRRRKRAWQDRRAAEEW